MAAPCRLARFHRLGYAQGLILQEHLVRRRQAGEIPDTLILLEHPPVYTLGKRREAAKRNIVAGEGAIAAAGATVEMCDRGGDVTYHGPGQLVGYPIVNVQQLSRPSVRRYVESLEDVMIAIACDYGVLATGRRKDETGAWVGNSKLGAVGVRVSQRVTSHGFGFNVSTDLSAFDLIVPCGLQDRSVTSLERELRSGPEARDCPSMRDVCRVAAQAFGKEFERSMEPMEDSALLDEVAAAGLDSGFEIGACY